MKSEGFDWLLMFLSFIGRSECDSSDFARCCYSCAFRVGAIVYGHSCEWVFSHVTDRCAVIGCCSGVDRDQRDLSVGPARETQHRKTRGTNDLSTAGANRHDQGNTRVNVSRACAPPHENGSEGVSSCVSGLHGGRGAAENHQIHQQTLRGAE